MSLKLVGASYGDPYDPHTISGAAKYLLDALARRYAVVDRLDFSLRGGASVVVAATSFRRPRSRWQERYYVNPLGHRLRSRRLRRELARLETPFDLLVQVFGFVEPPGCPYVVYADHTWEMAARAWPAWLPSRRSEHTFWYGVERRMYQGAAHVFAMGPPIASSLASFYDVLPDRVSIVGGGVNLDSLPRLDGLDREPVVLFVGREFSRKGCDVLLAAFAAARRQVPEARLQLVGLDGFSAPGVTALGSLPRSHIADLYRRASVFCLPSRHDSHPFVLTEAMAFGLPCVATAVGSIPQIVTDGETGLLVPPEDPDALAVALVRLLANEAEARRLGAAGRSRVEGELNWDRVVDRMAPALEAAVS